MTSTFKQRLWQSWESVFARFAGSKPIKPGEDHMFFVAKRRYIGRPFVVDGIRVGFFDRVIEIHMNNEMLAETLREGSSMFGIVVKLLQESKRSFPALAECVRSSEYDKERVLYGVTFIHRGVERMGFHTLPIRNRILARMTSWYLGKVFRIVNPDAQALLKTHPDMFVPKLVATSKEKLIEKYGVRHEPIGMAQDGGVDR